MRVKKNLSQFTFILTTIVAICQIMLARALALARQLIIALLIMAIIGTCATPASASDPAVDIYGMVDANDELRFYVCDPTGHCDQINSLTFDRGKPQRYVFHDFEEGDDTWKIHWNDAYPRMVGADCERVAGTLECAHDGSTKVELQLKATSQAGATKHAPILIKPGPETRPAKASTQLGPEMAPATETASPATETSPLATETAPLATETAPPATETAPPV